MNQLTGEGHGALDAPSRKRPLTASERTRRTHDWQSYSAVIRDSKGNEDVITVQALDEADARYRVGLRTKAKVINLIHNGEAW